MSTVETEIRLAGLGDTVRLAALRYEFRAAEGAPVESRPEFERRCELWMRDRITAGGGWSCWVAEADGEIVGHVWVQVFEKVPNPVAEAEKHGYITNLYVRPMARGHSIGAGLLAAALQACEQAGVDSVVLWATPQSRSLYARHGFTNSDTLLEWQLARSQGDA